MQHELGRAHGMYCINSEYIIRNVHIKEQFRQFILLETTSMRAPPKKVTTKGAPKKNKHFIRSTKDRLCSGRLLILKNNRHMLHRQIQQGQVERVHEKQHVS
jgi:hypothetical protein